MRWFLTGIALLITALAIPPSAMGEVVTLYNHSFEHPRITIDPENKPKPTGWIWTGDVDTGTTFERVHDPEAPDGEWILRVNSSGFEGLGGVHSPSLEVEPNQTYTVRMMVKVPLGRPLWPAISERRSDDTQIVFDEGPEYIGTGQWQLLEHTRAFASGVKLRAYWRMGGGDGVPGTFYLDAPPPPPSPPAAAPPPPLPAVLADPAPTVSNFAVTRRKFASVGGPAPRRVKRGTYFTYDLSERATVKITISRKKGRSFKPQITLRADQEPGQQFLAFSGRSRKKPLRPGRYRATVVATDDARQRSAPQRVSFRIVGG